MVTFRPTIVNAASDKQAAFAADKAKFWVKSFEKEATSYLSSSDADLADAGLTRDRLEAGVAEAAPRLERPIAAADWIELTKSVDDLLIVLFNDVLGLEQEERRFSDVKKAKRLGLI